MHTLLDHTHIVLTLAMDVRNSAVQLTSVGLADACPNYCIHGVYMVRICCHIVTKSVEDVWNDMK